MREGWRGKDGHTERIGVRRENEGGMERKRWPQREGSREREEREGGKQGKMVKGGLMWDYKANLAPSVAK